MGGQKDHQRNRGVTRRGTPPPAPVLQGRLDVAQPTPAQTPFLAKGKKLIPADKVYHRLLHDARLNVNDFDLGFEDGFKQVVYMPVSKFRDPDGGETEIPFHRVHVFRYRGTVVWDRTTKLDSLSALFESGGTSLMREEEKILLGGNTEDQLVVTVLEPTDLVGLKAKLRERHSPHQPPSSSSSSPHPCPRSSTFVDPMDDALESPASPPARMSTPPPSPKEEEEEGTCSEEDDEVQRIPPSFQLKIASFNILFDLFDAHKFHTEQRIPLICEELEKQDADVIGLQEVTPRLFEAIRAHSRILSGQYYWTTLPLKDKTGQVILSRYPITESVVRLMSKNKRCAFAVVRLFHRISVVVANCHLISDYGAPSVVVHSARSHPSPAKVFTGAAAAMKPEEGFPSKSSVAELDRSSITLAARRANELKTIFKKLAPHGYTILMGDFNFGDQNEDQQEVIWPHDYVDCFLATRSEEPVQKRNDSEEEIDQERMKDVPLEQRGIGGYTYDLTQNTLAEMNSKHHRYPRRLDRILCRNATPRGQPKLFGVNPTAMRLSVGEQSELVRVRKQRKIEKRILKEQRKEKFMRRLSSSEACGDTEVTAHLQVKRARRESGGATSLRIPDSDDDEEEEEEDSNVIEENGEASTSSYLLYPSDHFGLSSVIELNEIADLDIRISSSGGESSAGSSTSIRGTNFFPHFRSALCIIPPRALFPAIDDGYRSHLDKAFPRWMPHINILFPFVHPAKFPKAIDIISEALSNLDSFTITLKRSGTFSGRKKTVLFLEPETENDELAALYNRLQPLFPDCTRENNTGEYHPHLTLGQVERDSIRPFLDKLKETWTPTQFTVTHVHMIAHMEGRDVFEIMHSFPLGCNAPPSLAAVSPSGTSPMGTHASTGTTTGGTGEERPTVSHFEAPELIMEYTQSEAVRYVPTDPLEVWLGRHTDPSLARQAPTHVSQRGAMYHIPGHLTSQYIDAWKESIDNCMEVPFFVEEVRGSPFRLYVDFDFKLKEHEKKMFRAVH